MSANTNELLTWFDKGIRLAAAYMIVVCDTFENDDYPVYVMDAKEFWQTYASYDGARMQRIMEVYDLKETWEGQRTGRVFNTPPKVAQHG